jgi:alpha-mannosidase
MYETRERLDVVPDASLFSPAPQGTNWGGEWQYCWFRSEYDVPKELDGQALFLRPRVGGYEGLLYVNGLPFGTYAYKIAITGHGSHYCDMLTLHAKAGETISIAVEMYAGHYTPGSVPLQVVEKGDYRYSVESMDIYVKDELINEFYFDLKTINQMVSVLPETSFIRAKMINSLLWVHDSLLYSMEDSSSEEFQEALQKTGKILKDLLRYKNTSQAPIAGIIGHSHMDTAWQWTVEETVKKCARTYSNQISLMEQYPEYQFIQSSAFHSDMILKHYPELFSKIQEKVSEGRYEPNGGVWVECDCNIVSGETMIRQFLWGQRFTRKHFGYTSNAFWLPDTFGYSAAIPQIMKGSGVDYFLTTKMSWNDTNKFPYETFYWVGLDGTSVLSHLNRTHVWPDPETCFDIVSDGHRTGDTINFKTVSNMRLLSYGFGDGGGGPQFEMIEMARRIRDLEGCPKAEPMLVSDFMKQLEDTIVDPPVYKGELYLELHRGTLTNQHTIKRQNRLAEIALRNAEYLTVRHAVENSLEASSDEIHELMNTLLINQFHDILPGTCINAQHVQTIQQVKEVIEEANLISESKLQTKPASTLTVVNSLPFAREDVLYLDTNGQFVKDTAFQQLVSDLDGRTFLAVAGKSVPSLSSTIFELTATAPSNPSAFTFDGKILETPIYHVEFNSKAYIDSLYDKHASREIRDNGGLALGTLLFGEDIPLAWDNWDIDADVERKLLDCAELLSTQVISDGAVEFRIRNSYRLTAATQVTQDVIFYAQNRLVRYETRMNWNDHHHLLKVAFDTNVFSDFSRHEIQFGNVLRPTTRNNTLEQAKFEVCAHKYSDISETRYGVALLNDCKYGVTSKSGSFWLTLHKGGRKPDEQGDLGIHDCTYALLPHDSGFSAKNVIHPAYMLNIKPLICQGSLAQPSFAWVNADNIILETIKPCEDQEKAFILRLYEAEGAQTTTKVSFGISTTKIERCNMLEEVQEILGNESELTLRPFEIVTLKVSY